MANTAHFPWRRALLVLVAGSLGCSGDLLLPDPAGGGNVALSKLAGDNQTGTVGEQLASPLVVQVLTERQVPAPGIKVAFVLATDPAAGQVSPDTAVTNDQGQATARWVLGTAPGPCEVVARVVKSDGVTQDEKFTAAAKAAAPDTLSAQSPLGQPGRRGQEVSTPPVVRAVDKYGNPVSDVPVAWQITAGEGTVSDPIVLTGADGRASVKWTLGNRIGVHKLTAAIGQATGSPVTFTATVLF